MSEPGRPEEENPYSPPRDEPPSAPEELLFPFDEDSPETMRSTYGAQEASVRAIGLYLYLLAAIGIGNMVLILASSRFAEEITSHAGPNAAVPVVVMKIFVVIGALFGSGLDILLGFYLRRLHDWARWLQVAFCGFGILGSIIGIAFVSSRLKLEMIAMVGGLVFIIYVMIILLLAKNSVVFSENYRRVITRTPELSPRPSVRDWVFLGAAAAFYIGSLLAQTFQALS